MIDLTGIKKDEVINILNQGHIPNGFTRTTVKFGKGKAIEIKGVVYYPKEERWYWS